MEKTSNYFPKTLTALNELKSTASLLEKNAQTTLNKNQELSSKTLALKKQIAEKAQKIESIIQNLNGAVK